MLTLLLSLCGLALLVLSVIIIYSNYREATNRWLGAFTISGLLWLLANIFANLSSDRYTNLLFSRSALIGASLLPLTYLFFCMRFTHHFLGKRLRIAVFLPVIALLATEPTKLNVVSVSKGTLDIQPGISYIALLLILMLYFGAGIKLLLSDYRKAEQGRRQQLYYILLGTALTLVPAGVLSGILPVLGYPQAAAFGPAVSIFFSIFTAVAIIKHRLFDVRLVIARSLAYATSLIAIASLYGVVVFGIAQFIFGLRFSLATQVFISAATGLATLSFSNLKRTFDKLTNRLFYRDAYDSQDVIETINHMFVSPLGLNKLLHQVSQELANSLKAEFCLVELKEIRGQPQRIIGTQQREIELKDILAIRKLTAAYHQNIVATDYLDGQKYGDSKHLLQKNGIAVLVKLTPNVNKNEEGLGYLVLGSKKSGNPYNTQDFRVLDTISNGLVITIQNALRFEEIQNFNLTLQQKVVEATNKLRRTNEKLRALDETKDDFISMASHQLRTPLTSVKGYLSMVLEGDAGKLNTTQREMLGQAFFSSQRMVYLIADLLNVSRLKTGKFVIEPSSVNLANMVEEEMSQLTETAAAKSLQLTFDKPQDFPELQLDETKTRQVVMNFIDNAIYYTPAGGHIAVQLINKPSSVELRVVDDGIGVPKSEQHHLFTKFYRAANARKARPDGTGLGLFMAKKVISAQNGATIFESQEGKGSTFGFIFSKNKLNGSVPTPVKA